jgi:hypothetical protein
VKAISHGRHLPLGYAGDDEGLRCANAQPYLGARKQWLPAT